MVDDSLRADIEAKEAKYAELFNANNLKGVSALYAEDCKFMNPGRAARLGRQGVVDALMEMKSAGLATLKLTPEEVGGIVDGDTAFERGQYAFFKEDGTDAGAGKYLVVWKNVGGVYQMYLKCFNSN
ncbi:uncharacterized protein [Ptychodera flava]|uniref:uncharacterized protein n=1 Tax=Ptychodera flava TaxID=63121 RepID=UPI00396A7CDC